MAFKEMPPILSGSPQQQLNALRDYLWRMAKSLDPVTEGTAAATSVTYDKTGRVVNKPAETDAQAIAAVRKNAQELQALIIKSANELSADIEAGDADVRAYADRKTEEYNSMYVARSEYGEFTEGITSMIETTAKGVVESYDYASSIESTQDSIRLMQSYFTSINGEIRRGIVQDPDTGDYVTGIAIAQNLQFSGECGSSDPNNPGDGYTYYYMNSGQTFGLYTSVGWQFWIDGVKKGWYNSADGMLHVASILVEQLLQVGSHWQIKSSADGSEIEFYYAG